jgi:hypothetical protein
MRVLELTGAVRVGRVRTTIPAKGGIRGSDLMLTCPRMGWWNRTCHGQVLPKELIHHHDER